MNDTRILGRWRSDASKTEGEIRARADIPAGSKRRLSEFFGKLELRFTTSRCYSTLNDHTESAPYKIVAKDDTSVATISAGRITHIHFEGQRFWMLVGSGKFREYFRRVRPPNKPLQPTSGVGRRK
jgi:hypothetical protein